ncbi:hypothetical protein Rsub_02275 [Raphidocelis subcapitata]|uniref:Uncharacterized protein n=1 Tax=Raphidocelis subcapitata TaxID=307507 RepID=A0A2V0NXA7_9CHLO|nr:hypothetical protein Rsub_02275 [Raphidocelis subcapitata]|eukprot:GBF89557.1 hypothetical protein Rsub_02275 [Raphidocelis subcapitata]
MVCPVTLDWEQTSALIREGTVESLGKLGRSEEQLRVYRSFMAGVKEDYASVADFIKISVFEAAVHITDGKKQAVDSEHASADRAIWRPNDFPYNFEPAMQHWLLWCSREPPAARLQALVDAKFPPGAWDVLRFVNPPALQSVLSVWHCHVIVRPKPAP